MGEIATMGTSGLRSRMEWLVLDRGMDSEQTGAAGERLGNYSDEVPQRSFYRHWVQVMSEVRAGL